MDESILYLVRVWLRHGGFRAAVRAVDSDRVETFDAADALGRFFIDLVRGAREVHDDNEQRGDER